jgi:hypothetical protein
VPVTTTVLLLVLMGVLVEAAVVRRRRRTGWAWFWAWLPAGFLAALATLSFAIGLLVVPVAVVAILAAARFASGAETLGLLPGVGLTCFLVAAVGADDEGRALEWWLAGAAFAAAGMLLYALLRVAGSGRPGAAQPSSSLK